MAASAIAAMLLAGRTARLAHAEEEARAAPVVELAPPAPPAPPASPSSIELSPRRRALAIAAAIGPGLIAHGAGSWVAKRPLTARRLLTAQALGLGLMLAGGIPILVTYGSPKVTMPGVPITVTGFGIFAGSWLGDIWSAAGGDARGGVPRAELPRFLEAGLSWARDPYYGDRGYGELAGRWQWGRLAAEPHGRLELAGRAGEGGLDARWRLWGDAADGELAGCGHRLEARLGAYGRFDRDDELGALWQEVALGGRLDLRALDEALGGLFFEAEVGLGLDQTRYPTTSTGGGGGRGAVWDVGALLLARNAIGVYLGQGRGELAFSYDQRRDDLVGGFFAGRAAGFLGHVGAELQLRVRRGLALRVSAEVGTALLTTVALRYGGSR
jgi:hypothetical protein